MFRDYDPEAQSDLALHEEMFPDGYNTYTPEPYEITRGDRLMMAYHRGFVLHGELAERLGWNHPRTKRAMELTDRVWDAAQRLAFGK